MSEIEARKQASKLEEIKEIEDERFKLEEERVRTEQLENQRLYDQEWLGAAHDRLNKRKDD